MHGLIGCLTESRDDAGPGFRWMNDWIRLAPGKDTVEVRRPPFLFLGSNEPDSPGSPLTSGEDGVVLAFAGFIVRDQLADAEHGEPRTDSEVAAALLRAYRKEGAKSLAGLNGRYVAVVWDPVRNALHLANDVLGLKPLFLWHNGRDFYFSSNVWALVCDPEFRREVDPRGLVDLLLLSYQQANRTLFRDVSVLPPGGVVTVSGGQVAARPVRGLRFSDEHWGSPVEDIADQMHALLSQSIRRRVPERSRVLLPLSGGFDSRSMLGLLLKRRARIHAVTQRHYGLFGEDARYARKLARQTGVPHNMVPLDYGFLARYRERCVAVGGGMYDIHTGRMFSLLEQSGEAGLPVVSGHLGGELTGAFQISPASFSTPQEQADVGFHQCANEYRFEPEQVRRLLAPQVPGDLVDEAVEENKRFFLSHPGSFFQKCCNWDLLLSRRRYISYQLAYFEQFTRVQVPLYDRDFVDFMCTVPYSALEQQLAYRTMLSRHFPSLAAVPNVKGLPTLPSTRFQCFLIAKYKRFMGHLVLRIAKRWNTDSKPVIDHVFQSSERISQYLDPGRVRDAVDDVLTRDVPACMGVLGLSTFATVLDFLEDPYAALRAWGTDGSAQ